MKLTKPIFLLASERSGSNLIRVIFGNHPEVAAPPPIHLLDTFLPLFPCYENENFLRLCEDVCKEIKTQIGIWETDFTPQELFDCSEDKNLAAIYKYVYIKEAKAKNADRVFIKDNYSFNYFHYIKNHFPDAKFIYLVRDCRDYALSHMKNPAMFDSLETIAKQWTMEQRKCMILYSRYKETGNIMPVHYEDLVSDPESIIKAMCDFAELDFNPQMTEFYKDQNNIKDAKSSKAWENLNKPINKKNFRKYKKDFSKNQIFKIESVAYRELIHCGYPLENEIDRIIDQNKKNGFLKKGLQVIMNMLKGKIISPAELQRRKKHFETRNAIIRELEQNTNHVLDVPLSYN